MHNLGQVLLLLSVTPLVLSIPAYLPYSRAVSPAINTTTSLVARAPPDFHWIALGDSFSAGPGAGTPFGNVPDRQCYRNIGAYPPQLNDDFPYPVSAMQFLSCSGAVVDDMIRTQIPIMDPDQRFVTLSIGGNDFGFSRVLRACIFAPGASVSEDCDTVLDEVRRFVQNEYRNRLRTAWDAVFGRLINDNKRQVAVVFYPFFFNEDTDWCNDQSMPGVPYFPGPKLTRALRQELNALGDLVRLYTIAIGQQYVAEKMDSGEWTRLRLFAIDDVGDGDIYRNHRFCEEGVETFDNEDIHFFVWGGNDSPSVTAQSLLDQYDPSTCANDAKYKTDGLFGWYCDTVRYAATLPDGGTNITTWLPETVLKAFHPKTAAFTGIKDIHKRYIAEHVWPPEVNVDQGNLQCQPGRTAGNALWFASRDDMIQATKDFCSSTAAAGISPGLIDGVYNKMHVSAKMDDVTTNCPALDVTSDGFTELCESRLINAIDGCDLENKDPNGQLWKQGGSFYRDCVTWYVGVQASGADPSTVSSECDPRHLFAPANKCGLKLPTLPS